MIKSLVRWLRSLQAQLILWAILPVTFAIIAMAFTGVYTHQEEMRDFVAERNAVVTQLVAKQLENGLAQGLIPPDGQNLNAWLPVQGDDLAGTLYIIDNSGQVLAHTGAQPTQSGALDTSGVAVTLQQREGSVVLQATPDGPILLTFSPIMGTDWWVVLQEPVQGLLGPILRFSSLGPVVAIIAAGLSMLILTFGWRMIVHPLQQLAQAAGQVSGGDYTAIDRGDASQSIPGVVEIQELHQALHAMVSRIKGYEAGIHDYLDAITEGQEAERTRLARELHDGPVQTLIALSQRAEMARDLVERGNEEKAMAMLEKLRAAEVDVIEELRRIIGALRPIYLEDLGFVPALEMLVRAADARSDAQVRLEHGPGLRRLQPSVELAVYRIAQETLNNALQHAQAQTITVHVHCDEGGVTLRVVDDGIGFEPAPHLNMYTQQGHFGLVGVQERVRQLEGTLHLDAHPGHGTALTVHIPDRQRCEAGDTQ